ncbi:universal stress protein [Halomonas cerina]|uniref:Nucleotide-binding universal stress UspA family protein n=1 Tax=Halomonas cerina TaxID=447424 RepID=A0A839V767_9GAMM|nr:universal stress protein [Halomonas cerina]MBB3190991.1 nucleotide-binding universal stress UspA family protein [Halomonas cerina]
MKRFRNILYVIEPSVPQEAGLARAVSLAENNQAMLTLIDVLPEEMLDLSLAPRGPSSVEVRQAVIAERRTWIESLILPHADRITCHTEVLTGIKFIEVIRAVLRDDHDLVIKTAENPEWSRLLFGSDDMHLMRKCPCPVWLMKPEEKPNYRRIVAAVDFDVHRAVPGEQALNDSILDIASSLALSDFAELHLVHAWDAPEAGFVGLWANDPDTTERHIVEGEHSRHQVGMDRLTHHLRERIGPDAYDYLSPRVHLTMGGAKKKLPELVGKLKADLVVMGTVARTGIPGFIIGNTAEAVLYQLQCSVLALKPPGFVSPVTLE